MSMRHVLALAAAVLAVVMTPTAAHADTSFYADSGDSCRYGVTEGVLASSYATVPVKGTLIDRPLPTVPTLCRDDGFYSTATFTAYYGSRVVDQQAVRANNSIVRFSFVLGQNSTIGRIDRVVVQVCRGPVNTLPPTYCGKPAEYRAPF
jgi:hypothetical protein